MLGGVCEYGMKSLHLMTSQTQTRPCSHPVRSWLCSQKAQIDAFDPTDMRRLKCKTKYELNIIWNPLKARGGGFSTFLKLAQKVWWEVWMLRAPETRGEKKKTLQSQKSATENGKASFHFSALLQSHTGNPLRPWKRNTVSFAAEMGLPLAPLNFRLCLCGNGELLWVCRRPAGFLCHQ